MFSMLSLEESRHIVEQNVGIGVFDVLDVREIPLGKESGGYMSDYWHIEIRIRFSEGNEEKHRFFAKAVPQVESTHRDFVLNVHSYEKETGFYRNVVPVFKKYIAYSDTEKNEVMKSKWAPHCYLTKSDIIVMQDLSLEGFKTFNNRSLMDFNHSIVVMRGLANFHAASIIYEEKERKISGKTVHINDMFPETFISAIAMADDSKKGWFPSGIRALSAVVPLLAKCKDDPALQNLIQENISNICERNVRLFARSNKYRNVVCHGDLWSSNMMFRYDENGLPYVVRFVDFQLVRYAPPASDIIMFMYTTTCRNFRDRHFDHLLNAYYDELATELKRNDLSPQELLPFEELKHSCEVIRPAGRVAACLYFEAITITKEQRKSIFTSPEKFSKFFLCDREAETREWFLSDAFYRSCLEEAMNEIIENDILKENVEIKK